MYFKKLFIFSFVCSLVMLTAFINPSSAVYYSALPVVFQDTFPGIDSTIEKVYEKVEIEASFPGGDKVWRNFLEQKLNATVPLNYGAPPGKYTVIVQFVVDKEGKISDLKALTNHGYGMEAEVIRLLKKAPKWNPAIQEGRPVKAYRKQPVTFWIQEDRRKNKRD